MAGHGFFFFNLLGDGGFNFNGHVEVAAVDREFEAFGGHFILQGLEVVVDSGVLEDKLLSHAGGRVGECLLVKQLDDLV